MMGEANYNATNIICDSAVKYVLFQCEIQLNDATDDHDIHSCSAARGDGRSTFDGFLYQGDAGTA